MISVGDSTRTSGCTSSSSRILHQQRMTCSQSHHCRAKAQILQVATHHEHPISSSEDPAQLRESEWLDPSRWAFLSKKERTRVDPSNKSSIEVRTAVNFGTRVVTRVFGMELIEKAIPKGDSFEGWFRLAE